MIMTMLIILKSSLFNNHKNSNVNNKIKCKHQLELNSLLQIKIIPIKIKFVIFFFLFYKEKINKKIKKTKKNFLYF